MDLKKIEKRIKEREECSRRTITNDECLDKLALATALIEEVRKGLNPDDHEEIWIPHLHHMVRNSLNGAVNCIAAAAKTIVESEGK